MCRCPQSRTREFIKTFAPEGSLVRGLTHPFLPTHVHELAFPGLCSLGGIRLETQSIFWTCLWPQAALKMKVYANGGDFANEHFKMALSSFGFPCFILRSPELLPRAWLHSPVLAWLLAVVTGDSGIRNV